MLRKCGPGLSADGSALGAYVVRERLPKISCRCSRTDTAATLPLAPKTMPEAIAEIDNCFQPVGRSIDPCRNGYRNNKCAQLIRINAHSDYSSRKFDGSDYIVAMLLRVSGRSKSAAVAG